VEGSSRRTERDYLRFLEVAFGSACEVRYLLGLSRRLRFLKEEDFAAIHDAADHVCKALNALIESIKR
jgi:four helix bundle protein